MAYDAGKAFARIEEEMIESMMRNLKRHLKEEDDEGFDWNQWQVEQLKYLTEYRKKNRKKYGPEFARINKRIEDAIRYAKENGQKDEEKRILETLSRGNVPQRQHANNNGTAIEGSGDAFFRINDKKLESLVKSTHSDLQKAEQAVLRRSNDQYRKIIFDAQMYANTGAGTIQKAVDMATKDFLLRGIDSIVYKNGCRHTISDYADMAIRTAERRAYLMGEGEKRKEWGEELVIVNKRGSMRNGDHGTACPQCIVWLGKVLVDDVYSGGKPDGKHQLLSTAMQQGFLHPRCKDGFTTYFPWISSAPDPDAKKSELKAAVAAEKEENRENYAEKQAERYERLAKYSLDPENQKKYEARAKKWRIIAEGYESSSITTGFNAPAITNPEEVVEEFISAIDLPTDEGVIAKIRNSVRHMPKEDLDMIRGHGLIVRKTKSASCFVRSRRSRGADGKLKYVIRINPDQKDPFVFAHECAHFAEKVNNLYDDPEFYKILEHFTDSIREIGIGEVDGEYYATGISDLLIEPYQGRTYVKDLGAIGLERKLDIKDYVEYISVGYECYIGEPELLERKDPVLYNYFVRRGLR